MSERVIAAYANSAIFQLYYGENKLTVNEMMIRSALYLTNTLSWIFIVLVPWKNSASSMKQQLADRQVRGRTTLKHYPDSEPTSLWSFSLMLRA